MSDLQHLDYQSGTVSPRSTLSETDQIACNVLLNCKSARLSAYTQIEFLRYIMDVVNVSGISLWNIPPAMKRLEIVRHRPYSLMVVSYNRIVIFTPWCMIILSYLHWKTWFKQEGNDGPVPLNWVLWLYVCC